MNPAIGLALLAFAQLVLALIADKSLGGADLPIVTQQLSEYPTLGIKDFFATGGTVNKTRVSEVVRITRLPNAARSALVALFVAFIGALVTAAIAFAAAPTIPHKVLRVAFSVGSAVVAFILMGTLVVKLLTQALRSASVKEASLGPPPADRLRRYLKRVRDFNVLTPYLTAALVINTISIIAAFKLG